MHRIARRPELCPVCEPGQQLPALVLGRKVRTRAHTYAYMHQSFYTHTSKHIHTYITETHHRQLGRDFVMIVEGTAPLTATGLFEGPRRVSNVQSYQTRYWGFAAAGASGGGLS